MKTVYVLLIPLLAVLIFAPPAAAVIPAIMKVIDMLNNLVTTLTNEGVEDEQKFSHFSKWVAKEQEETKVEIKTLQTKIEDTKATLAGLYAQRGELFSAVTKLKGEVATTTNQINTATDKRNEEHSAFVTEQTNFDNAIAACNKAVEILGKHYGDGSEEEIKKPEFMSYLAIIRQAATSLDRKATKTHKTWSKIKPHSWSFLQGHGKAFLPGNDRFEAKTGEALSIVDQVKVLSSTFAEDKQTAIEEEAKLQSLYDNLMTEKKAVLADLMAQLAEKTTLLNGVKQDIASNENKMAMMQKNLEDEQNYLASITEQHKVFSEAFALRKKDREEEMAAVNKALSVLDKYNTFVQLGKTKRSLLSRLAPAQHVKCKGCSKAVSFLKSKANIFHSALLEAAATASAGMDAVDEIVKNLEGLMVRIDQEQKFETEHKEWCEQETGLTTKKRDDHRYVCDDLKAVLANLAEVVQEKKDDLTLNDKDQDIETDNFDDRTKIRDEQKSEFELDLQEHNEAIQALNEAIDILAKYYASRDAKGASFAQTDGKLFGPGGTVVNMLSETRHEFEVAKEHLEKDEDLAIKEYSEDKSIHIKTDNNLKHQEDTLTVEEQTAEEQIDQNEQDLTANKDEVVSAENYLDRLGKSCYPLIARYEERKKLRAEEKQAITDAIKVLKEELR
jgi:hypothetical protein